jgi:hypothetical protein
MQVFDDNGQKESAEVDAEVEVEVASSALAWLVELTNTFADRHGPIIDADLALIYNQELMSHVQGGASPGSQIPGVGPWTRKALGIMTRSPGFEDVFLWEDAWISARGRQLGLPHALAKTGHTNWAGFRGQVSAFLWRLTPKGADHIRAQVALTAADFL